MHRGLSMLARISSAWATFELTLAALLAVAVSALILLNVVTRSLGAAIYWVDELAIYCMVWMAFLAASAALHYGNSVAVTLFRDILPERPKRLLIKFVDLVVLIFALAMLWFCWLWYRPDALIRAGFDIQRFQGATFNFIYSEPTTTLGIPKFWVWLVMWFFSFGAFVHSLHNLFGASGSRKDAS
jgi:TRAP-type C4-dicarboxylate transport system permease small subunit